MNRNIQHARARPYFGPVIVAALGFGVAVLAIAVGVVVAIVLIASGVI